MRMRSAEELQLWLKTWDPVIVSQSEHFVLLEPPSPSDGPVSISHSVYVFERLLELGFDYLSSDGGGMLGEQFIVARRSTRVSTAGLLDLLVDVRQGSIDPDAAVKKIVEAAPAAMTAAEELPLSDEYLGLLVRFGAACRAVGSSAAEYVRALGPRRAPPAK